MAYTCTYCKCYAGRTNVNLYSFTCIVASIIDDLTSKDDNRSGALLRSIIIPFVSGLAGVLLGALIVSTAVTFVVCWCRKHKRTPSAAHPSSSVARRPRSPSAAAASDPPASSDRRPGDGRGPLPAPDTLSDGGSDRLPASVQASIRRRVNDWLRTAVRASMTVRERAHMHLHTDPNLEPGLEISACDTPPGLSYRVPPSPPPCLRPPPYPEAAACMQTASPSVPPPDRPSKDVCRVANETPVARAQLNDRPVFTREDSHEYLPLHALDARPPSSSLVLPETAIVVPPVQCHFNGAEPVPTPPARTSSLTLASRQQISDQSNPTPLRLSFHSTEFQPSTSFTDSGLFSPVDPRVPSHIIIAHPLNATSHQSTGAAALSSRMRPSSGPSAPPSTTDSCSAATCFMRAISELAEVQVDLDSSSMSTEGDSRPAIIVQNGGQNSTIVEVATSETDERDGTAERAAGAHANVGFLRSTDNLSSPEVTSEMIIV